MKRLWYWLKRLKSDIFLLYLAFKDPRVPRQAKILLMLLAAYIISPIDILPDFVIPGLGYIDDLALISYVAGFIQKMIPEAVLSDLNLKAMRLGRAAKSWAVAVLVLAGLLLALLLGYRFLGLSLY
ncbi:MAG: YkvA family protein [Pelotomaculaceae bacterium]|uniref:DUF1232 domain-containing protein n=1 Tax=anaerobic digester metagenome TaxID=1263854 RepID=A0A485LZF7_9ZZZZ|nr:YkvA family protein [Bacillota bacterium]HHU86453.1 DUF1232 domain-containing protein [Peptococcaceae bacterium]